MILSRKTKLKLLTKGLILTAITAESIIHMPLIEPVYASTASSTISTLSGDIQFVQNNALLSSDKTYTVRNSTNKNVDYVYNKIYTGLKNHEDTIEFSADEISKYNIVQDTATDPKKVYINVVTECPDIYFAPTRILQSFGSVACLYVSYIYNQDEITQLDKELNEEADRIIKQFDGYSDIRKVYEIHDYIANKCTYDNEMAEASMPKSSLSMTDWDAYLADNTRVLRENRRFFNTHNVYGALIDGRAVCEGYAKAFAFLLKRAGIDAGILCSDNHAWSYVQIDGKYYQVDLTWDDDEDFLTSTPYKLFATTSDLMEKKHSDAVGTILTEPAYIPDCSDKKFDSFLRRNDKKGNNFPNNIYRVNNKLYELSNDKNIYSYDLNGENKKKVKDLSQYTYVHDMKVDNENIYFITGDNLSKYTCNIKKMNIKTGDVSDIVNVMDWFNLDGSDYPCLQYYIQGNKLTAIYSDFVNETTKTMPLDGSVESQNLTKATKAVNKAEASLDRNDYNDAKTLVDNLNDGSDKTALENKLADILKQIEANEKAQSNTEKLTNATKAVNKAEASLDRNDYNDAKTLVDNLNDGSDKTTLENKLADILKQIEANEKAQSNNATKAVNKAEASLDRNDYNDAKTLVDNLNDGSDKTTLENKLADILKQIEANEKAQSNTEKLTNATKAVNKAETSLDRSDYNDAKTLVDNLNDGSDKTALENKLADVLNKIKANEQSQSNKDKLENATKALKKVESSLSKNDYNTAKTLVDSLPNGAEKIALENRLANVLNQIKNKELENQEAEEKAQKLSNAKKAVEKAESSLSKDDYNTAKILVDNLTNGTDKTALQNRLSNVSEKINKKQESSSNGSNNSSNSNSSKNDDYDDASDALEEFKDKLTTTKYKKAKKIIYDLDDSEERDELIKELKKYKKKLDRKIDNDDDDDDYSSSNVDNNSNINRITNDNKNYNYIANSTGPLMPTSSFTSNHSYGWSVDNTGKWYYYNPTGSKHTGWLADGKNSYLFDSNGQMITGWFYDSSIGKWYYFNKSSDGVEGQLRTGWFKSNEKWYYLDPNNGTMVTDRYVNGYYLGSDGAWV